MKNDRFSNFIKAILFGLLSGPIAITLLWGSKSLAIFLSGFGSGFGFGFMTAGLILLAVRILPVLMVVGIAFRKLSPKFLIFVTFFIALVVVPIFSQLYFLIHHFLTR